MRTRWTTTAATTTAAQDRSPLRVVVAALVLLFAISAGPAAAASSSEGSDHAAGPGAGSTGSIPANVGGSGWEEAPLLVGLHALIREALAAVAEVPRANEDARPTQGDVSKASARRFRMNLFRKGDFVSQKTTFWCIPASTQMMINMMDGGRPNRSRAMQARLYRIGDRLEEDGTFSSDPEPDRWRGMGISEWVGLLNRYDYGPYELAGARSLPKALKKAARMMRKTGKPVGLVVWRGAHAWVMSGFVATADPAVTNDYKVTKVWVQDPWYPRTSSIWGRSRGPNAKVSPRVLRQDFKRYGRPGRRNPERDGRFMLVLPRPDRSA